MISVCYDSFIETQTEKIMAVYGYIRVSTEGKGQTTENQRKLIVDGGIAVSEFFSEDGVSGSVKASQRPAFSHDAGSLCRGRHHRHHDD
jgi:hypothetical protein